MPRELSVHEDKVANQEGRPAGADEDSADARAPSAEQVVTRHRSDREVTHRGNMHAPGGGWMRDSERGGTGRPPSQQGSKMPGPGVSRLVPPCPPELIGQDGVFSSVVTDLAPSGLPFCPLCTDCSGTSVPDLPAADRTGLLVRQSAPPPPHRHTVKVQNEHINPLMSLSSEGEPKT